jgi:hypothetical protein
VRDEEKRIHKSRVKYHDITRKGKTG